MHELVAVYGTLRRQGRLHRWMGEPLGRSRLVGTATIDGVLHEVSVGARDASVDVSYPCLTLDEPGRVVVELYELVDPLLLAELDELEGFDPERLDDCEYHRRRVPLHDVAPIGPARPGLAPAEAWTYVYVRAAPHPDRRIAGGDWIAHHG